MLEWLDLQLLYLYVKDLPEGIKDIKNETRTLTKKIDYVEKTVDRIHQTLVCF